MDRELEATQVKGPAENKKDEILGTVTYRSFVPQFRSDRYTPQRFHARGGMGEIWIASDGEIGRLIALKTLRKKEPNNHERFLAEAQIAGQLEHPGIVPVHDVGVDKDGHVYYVMKLVEGRTLQDAIDEFFADQDAHDNAEVERRRLLDTFLDLCDAVAYAHSRGVIHRDIKPNNVMLGQFGETLVLDWGLAKVLHQPEIPGLSSSSVAITGSGRSTATQAGSVLGTPAYMPPELADGHASDVGVACDVYLLGATLYHILTGKAPRRSSSHQEMVDMARTVPPVPPRAHRKDVPRAMEAICLKAMARRQEDRYETARERSCLLCAQDEAWQVVAALVNRCC